MPNACVQIGDRFGIAECGSFVIVRSLGVLTVEDVFVSQHQEEAFQILLVAPHAMEKLVKDRETLFDVHSPGTSKNLIELLGVPEKCVHLLFLGLRDISPSIQTMASSIFPDGTTNMLKKLAKMSRIELVAECNRMEIPVGGSIQELTSQIRKTQMQKAENSARTRTLGPKFFQGGLIVSNGIKGRAFFGLSFDSLALILPCWNN